MAKRIYTQEVIDFVRENIKGKTTEEIVEITNAKFGTEFTNRKMSSFKKNYGIVSGIGCGIPAGRGTKAFPKEVLDYVKKNHEGIPPIQMQEILNHRFSKSYTHKQIKALYARNNLNSGITGYFEKGSSPWNKGMKGLSLGGKETQFKVGEKPPNWMPLGSERVTRDGYVEVKIKDRQKQRNWRAKHLVIWEKENGKIAEGHAVIFGDGDRRNFDIDNLILVSRKQLATLNKHGLIQNHADLTKTGLTIVDLLHKISERK